MNSQNLYCILFKNDISYSLSNVKYHNTNMSAETFIKTTDINSIPQVQTIKDPKAAVSAMNNFFISHFFKLMYNTADNIQEDSAFGGSTGEKIFKEFLINEYSNVIGGKFDFSKKMLAQYVTPQGMSFNIDA